MSAVTPPHAAGRADQVGVFLDKQARSDYLSSTLRQRVPTRIFVRACEEVQMGFRPLHDRVLIRRVEAEEKTQGGIIIPDTAKEKPQEGEVLAVGTGIRDENGKL